MSVCLVKNLKIGEGKPKICIPVIDSCDVDIIKRIKSFQDLIYDLIELRIDFYKDLKDLQKVYELLMKIRRLTDQPILLTYRSFQEGGQVQLNDEQYLELIKTVCQSQCIDMVDIELMSGTTLVYQLVDIAHQNNVKVLMSNHDFEKTPTLLEMRERLETMEVLQADICKLAVMPQTYKDVINLLNITMEMSHKLNVPLVTMSMGELGVISRIAGELTGSTITFASVEQASAPGQIQLSDMQLLLEAIHHD